MHDYRTAAAYHVTICIDGRRRTLCSIRGREVVLTDMGRVVVEELLRTFKLRPYAVLEAYVIMPDHVHLLVRFPKAQCQSPTPQRAARGPQPRSLSALIGAFKAASARAMRQAFPRAPRRIWQRGFHDRIIRDERAFAAVIRYIELNPERWHRPVHDAGRTDRAKPSAAKIGGATRASPPERR